MERGRAPGEHRGLGRLKGRTTFWFWKGQELLLLTVRFSRLY